MVNQRDVFLLGMIHCLKVSLQTLEESDETANDIDFEHVLEMGRRNLSNPDLEELIQDISGLEDLR